MNEDSWGSWFDRVADVGTRVIAARNTPQTARPPAAPPPNTTPPWLKPVLIGGGALALVLVLLAAFKK